MGSMEHTAQYLHAKQALEWLNKGGHKVNFRLAPEPATAPAAARPPAKSAKGKGAGPVRKPLERNTVRAMEDSPPKVVLVGTGAVVRMADLLSVSTERLLTISDISTRTYHRRQKEKKDLTGAESDRLLRIARVAAEAERVFGDEAKSSQWLNTFSVMLGAKPLELLATDAGSRAVEDELVRIEYGDFT